MKKNLSKNTQVKQVLTMEERYKNTLTYLKELAVQIYNKPWTLMSQDAEVVWKLLCYFTDDKPIADRYKIDLSKGILLIGPVGCGKTFLMNLFKVAPQKQFCMKPCRDIAVEFASYGFDIIVRYGKTYYPNICFDDLGAENNMNYFGNATNVMAEILQFRYEQFFYKKEITHLTSNLTPDEIEETYGFRVRSRMREMCNVVYFDKNSPDKRK